MTDDRKGLGHEALTNGVDVLRAKINSETAQIAWTGVERFFAQGKAIHVRPGTDLVEAALVIAQDRHVDLKRMMDAAQVSLVSDAQAQEWVVADALMWSVVVRPWVLVQPLLAASDSTESING